MGYILFPWNGHGLLLQARPGRSPAPMFAPKTRVGYDTVLATAAVNARAGWLIGTNHPEQLDAVVRSLLAPAVVGQGRPAEPPRP